MLCLPR